MNLWRAHYCLFHSVWVHADPAPEKSSLCSQPPHKTKEKWSRSTQEPSFVWDFTTRMHRRSSGLLAQSLTQPQEVEGKWPLYHRGKLWGISHSWIWKPLKKVSWKSDLITSFLGHGWWRLSSVQETNWGGKSLRHRSDQWQRHWMTSGKSLFRIVPRIRRGGGGGGGGIVSMHTQTSDDCAAAFVFPCLGPTHNQTQMETVDGHFSLTSAPIMWSLLSSQGHSNSSPSPLSVCLLFVCKQDYTNTTEQITTKLGGRMLNRSGKSSSRSGGLINKESGALLNAILLFDNFTYCAEMIF